MAGTKHSLNTIYVSERLQESLRSISSCPLTVVVAPMGYGKTTAVNWYLAKCRREENAAAIRISIYAASISAFWKRVQVAFAAAGFDSLAAFSCPTDEESKGLFADELCSALGGGRPYYIFIDDFHLLGDVAAVDFICRIARRLPKNVHIIVASRDRFLRGEDIFCLGSSLHCIGTEKLTLNRTEIEAYASRGGIHLDSRRTEELLRSSEGWFSAVYLNLRFFEENGALPDGDSDIYEMFTGALIDPLSPNEQEFLAVMSLADEFTEEMAEFVTQNTETCRLLSALTEQNAFVTRLSDGKTLRFHHMMKTCAGKIFDKLLPERRRLYQNRYGEWYCTCGQYLKALEAYKQSENYDGWLSVVAEDVGVMLASCSPEEVLAQLDKCPREAFVQNPGALLVLMRRCFSWGRYREMLALRELVSAALAEKAFSDEERGNLDGECDLIMSFLCYNDIAGMSALHQSACCKMNRPAASIKKYGSFTFGSPSVLMMFHRTPGAMAQEVQTMNAAMPYYYKVTQEHGAGAEMVMEAEAHFLRGEFAEAKLMNAKALYRAEEKHQKYIAQCCNMLALRQSLAGEGQNAAPDRANEREKLLSRHDSTLFLAQNAVFDYYFALLQEPEKASPIFAQHRLGTVNVLNPARPMLEMVENQVLLAQKEYERVIARSELLLAMCQKLHYALVTVHIKIQTAAAYEMLGMRQQAAALLSEAAAAAAPDGIVMSFAENYEYLAPLLTALCGGEYAAFAEKAIALGKQGAARRKSVREGGAKPAAIECLSPKEEKIARLAAERATNREIAEKLFLSEGTVKQYINQIYSKLGIEGDTRTKRGALTALFGKN